MTELLTVVGFPKTGTTALMKAMENHVDFRVLKSPKGSGFEVVWPQIRSCGESRMKDETRIVAHKFSGYIYNNEALQYLARLPARKYVLCIRDPARSLVSWHNFHKGIATDGHLPNHIVWRERAFYAGCTLRDYYFRMAQPLMQYDRHVATLFGSVGSENVFIISQERMAKGVDQVVAALIDFVRPGRNLGSTATAAGSGGARHMSFADTAQVRIDGEIGDELQGIVHNLNRLITTSQARCHF